jgi:hypothetical protein
MLTAGQSFMLDGATTALGTNERVGLDYKDLPRDVKPGDTLLLNDGLLRADGRGGARRCEVHTTVVKIGGELSNNKGINKAGGGLTAPALDRQGHGGHQDRDGLPVRVPGGELPEERHRHGNGAPAVPTWPASRGGTSPH